MHFQTHFSPGNLGKRKMLNWKTSKDTFGELMVKLKPVLPSHFEHAAQIYFIAHCGILAKFAH